MFNGHNAWSNHYRELEILLACGCLIIKNVYIIASGYCRNTLYAILALLKTTTTFSFLKNYWFYFYSIFSSSHDCPKNFGYFFGKLQQMSYSYVNKLTWIHFLELMTDSSFLNRAKVIEIHKVLFVNNSIQSK